MQRRYFTFRLRTLLIAIAVLCCLMAWRAQSLNHRQLAFDAITDRAQILSDGRSWANTGPFFGGSSSPDFATQRLRGLFSPGLGVSTINFYNGRDPQFYQLDTILPLLPALSEIRVLSFADQDPSGILPTVARLHQLEELALYGIHVGDDELAHLSRLTRLRFLFIGSHRMTAAGLIHLQALPNLQYLDLTNTQLGDEAVDQLVQFPKLKKIALPSGVSYYPLLRLRAVLPGCRYIGFDRLPR